MVSVWLVPLVSGRTVSLGLISVPFLYHDTLQFGLETSQERTAVCITATDASVNGALKFATASSTTSLAFVTFSPILAVYSPASLPSVFRMVSAWTEPSDVLFLRLSSFISSPSLNQMTVLLGSDTSHSRVTVNSSNVLVSFRVLTKVTGDSKRIKDRKGNVGELVQKEENKIKKRETEITVTLAMTFILIR